MPHSESTMSNNTDAAGGEWRSIDTAPRDGRTILLGKFNSHGKWRTMRGQWFSEAVIAETWEEPDDQPEGWYETSVEADDVPNCWLTEPSHWMPLPAAPDSALSAGAQPAAQEPLGWLYDWTHSSALGKPDEHFTGFTEDEAYARNGVGHRNVRPVFASPHPAPQQPDARDFQAQQQTCNEGVMDTPENRMFLAAVQSLAEISKALGIPDDEAAVANGNDLILDAIEQLMLAEPTDAMVDAACATVPDLFRVDAVRIIEAAWMAQRAQKPDPADACRCPCCQQGIEAPHEYHLERRPVNTNADARDALVRELVEALRNELQRDIMNLPPHNKERSLLGDAYREGHRDARHDAVGLLLAALSKVPGATS